MKSIIKDKRAEGELVWVFITMVVIVLLAVAMVGIPIYKVWTKEMSGKADLAEAEWSKQILIEEAKAEMESANWKAKAEVIRAQGVADANQIIGVSLKDNDAYLRYLWIQGLQDGSSEVIYIPTEGNLPILEATRKIPTTAAT